MWGMSLFSEDGNIPTMFVGEFIPKISTFYFREVIITSMRYALMGSKFR